MQKAAAAARDALPLVARAGGAAALREMRATAAPFKEVLRVLETVVVEEGSAAAAAPASSSPAGTAPAVPGTACAACGASGARLTCGGCRGVRYCGAECQKRDWRAHKAACKQQRR